MKEVVLVIGAHPDDIEFYAGGTIAQFHEAGKEVFYLITTNGQRGTLDPNANSQEIIKTREKETREAAAILGVKEVIFLGYEDGFLDRIPHLELREKYIYYIRKLKPRIVMTFDPWNPYEPHSDHRKTALAAFESCYFAHYPLFHPDQNLPKHFVGEIWLFRTPKPNTWMPLQLTRLRTKVKALLKHATQMEMLKEETLEQLKAASVDISSLEHVDTKTIVDIFVRTLAAEAGNAAGHKFAEAFNVLKLGYTEEIKKMLGSL
jgi:LmbE family N-acetylglucosaminyl deacetylase